MKTPLPYLGALVTLLSLIGCSSANDHTRISVIAADSTATSRQIVSVDADDIIRRHGRNILVTSDSGDTIPWQFTHDGKLLMEAVPGLYDITQAPEGSHYPDTICLAQIRPDKQDDIAWENDHGGYRLYGPAYHRDGGSVRGYDIWTKSVSHPVLAARYEGDRLGISYHIDHGDGMDVYTVGPTLGAGLNALVDSSGSMIMPAGYHIVDILDNGPLRLSFRLTTDPLLIDGDTIIETRTITLDRGAWLNRTDVSYSGLHRPTPMAAGIVVHDSNPLGYHLLTDYNTLTYTDLTDNPDGGNGEIYIAIHAPVADSISYEPLPADAKPAVGHIVALQTVQPDSAYTYYWGAAWSKGGVESRQHWDSLVTAHQEEISSPYTASLVSESAGFGFADIFKYIIALGAAVMMPVIFTLLGICIRIPFGRALMCGLKVGVGFVGLSIVTALLTSSLGPALEKIIGTYDLNLQVFDMGWPAAASVAYNTAVGAFIIPVCLAVNILMLLTRTTRTVNIDLWNYWHYAFIGAVVYFAADSLLWGFAAAVICYIITLVIADITARRFQKFYDGVDGISIPQPFCAGFVPFAAVISRLLDRIPGLNRIDIDAEGLKRRFGVLGEPLFLGVIVGAAIGCLTCRSFAEIGRSIPYILGLGIKMGAVMELIPRITSLFIEGLRPISEATRDLVARRFRGARGLNIGMSPAIVIGHPTTLVVSLLLIPFTLLIAVILPGNQFLPLASLAGMFYIFPLVLPYTRGNVLKTFIVGLIILVIGLLMVTDMAHAFTLAAHDVYAATGDPAVAIPEGFEGGSLDFASSPLSWIIYKLTAFKAWRIAGATILVAGTMVLLIRNRINIIKSANMPQNAE